MKRKFVCPNCGTRFHLELEEGVDLILCPTCGANIPVPWDEIGTLGGNLRQAALGEWNWVLWCTLAFAGIWGLIILVIVVSHEPAKAPVTVVRPTTVAPPPPPPSPAPPSPPPPPVIVPTVVEKSPTTTPKPAFAAVHIKIDSKRPIYNDEAILNSIKRGVGFLLGNMTDGELDPKVEDNVVFRQGIDALAVYALLHCSHSTHDDRISINTSAMKLMLQHLKGFPMKAGEMMNQPITYSRSLRSSALSIYNRSEDRETLAGDLQWLLRAEEAGAYTYDDVFVRPGQKTKASAIPAATPGVHAAPIFSWDNSNSQYGLIGTWNCAEAGLSVPGRYWQDVEQHWLACQLPDGTWGYGPGPGPRISMTLAGITALSVCRDYMNRDQAESPPIASARAAALEKSIRWLETGDNAVTYAGGGSRSFGYTLYGLERAALASGIVFAGTHDVYREMASQLLQTQLPGGSWQSAEGRDAAIQTAFSLLFLARGRNPVMMNKLRYDGGRANHPRDLASLTRYATYAMERPVNWQAVSLAQPWSAWMESPILYIAGTTPPALVPQDYDRLKSYVENGGLILTHADNGSQEFTNFAKDLAGKLFPQYPIAEVPENDDLFTLQFNIARPRPKLLAVSNGTRRLMIHCADDIAAKWQGNDPKRDPAAFQFGLNIFLYATGKADLRPKSDSNFIPAAAETATQTLSLARIQYAGNWDPEPGAWPRFARYFEAQTGVKLSVATVAATELNAHAYPMATIIASAESVPAQDDFTAMGKFANAGGTLFIDCSGGAMGIAQSVRKQWLSVLAPGAIPQAITPDDPILTGTIADIDGELSPLPKVILRPFAIQISKPPNSRLMEIKIGKGRIVFSEIDVTSGLLGTNTWGITGYTSGYAQPLMRNLVLDSATRQNLQESK